MNDKTLNILKVIGVIMGGIAGIVGLVLLFNFLNFSCISAPERLEDESVTCFEARMFVYYAKSGSNKTQLPESVTTEGVRNCFAKMRRDDCQAEMNAFLDKYGYDPNKYNIQNVSLYNNAKLNFKDCILTSSK